MPVPQFEIIRFTATDDVELCGFYHGGRRKRVAIYLHGLGGNGYRSRMMPVLAAACNAKGIGFFSLNTRGADVVAGRTQGEKRSCTNGAVYEIFDESLYDIKGAVKYLRSRGAEEFYLLGHSTGANKIAYAVQQRVRGVKKVVYIAPGDDVGIQEQLLGSKQFAKMQALASSLRRKQPNKLMPCKNLGYLDISAASFHSLFGKRNQMDQFPFRTLKMNRQWKRLFAPRTPAMLVLGKEDEYLDVPLRDIEAFFNANAPKLRLEFIAGGTHSFTDKEAIMASRVVRFLCE